MTSMVGKLITYRGVRKINNYIEGNGSQVSDGQRRIYKDGNGD